MTAARVELFQMRSQYLGVCGRPSLRDCVCRYCVIQWVEERGCCIVKRHNLPFWLMTEDVKRTLVSQGVAAFARAVCAMLRCHQRRKGAVAQLQKCPAVSKVSSTSVRPLTHACPTASNHPHSLLTRSSADGLHSRGGTSGVGQGFFRLPQQRRAVPRFRGESRWSVR